MTPVNASANPRISPQAVGAYGEKSVEAELLRRGWVTTNVNDSIKNVADFDIFALKGERTVHIRVKTSGPGMDAFQFSGRLIGMDPLTVRGSDFAVLVRMGATRTEDEFYILSTRVLLDVIRTYKGAYLAQAKRDGGARKDIGHWTLRLAAMRDGEDRTNYGLRDKWAVYRNNWDLLEISD